MSTSRAPSRASSRASASPIPDDAPVISAAWPSNFMRAARASALEREHPHDAALRHDRLRAARAVDARRHALRVDAPARLHGDVLHAVDLERGGHARDAGVRALLPEQLARGGVERVEVAVVRTAAEHET